MASLFKSWQWLFLLPLIILAYASIDFTLRNIIIMPGFLALERNEATKDLSRCTNAIDWAEFDDMYQYVLDKNSDFGEANLQIDGLADIGIDVLYILNSEAQKIWSGTYNRELEKEIVLTELPSRTFPLSHPLLTSPGTTFSGILLTKYGPMIIASHPILPTSGKGTARGTLIMGKFLFNNIIEDLQKQVRVIFSIQPLDAPGLSKAEKKIIQELSPGMQIHRDLDHDTLHSYAILTDLENSPALLLSAKLPRNILKQGRKTAFIAS